MDWRRFKNIIIIVLVIINVFFCGFLVRLKILDSKVGKQTQANVISVLEKSNIIMEEKDFPKNRDDYSACYVSRYLPSDENFVNGIIGKDGKYSSDNEVMTFEIEAKGKQGLEKEAVISSCRGFMEEHKIASNLYAEEKVDVSEKEAKVRFCLEYDEEKFFDSYIEFSLNNKGIYKVKGKNIIKAEENIGSYENKLLPVEGIVVAMAKDKKTDTGIKVEKISFGYYLGNSAETYVSVLALPVWEIDFSDGDKLYYDARNGNLISM